MLTSTLACRDVVVVVVVFELAASCYVCVVLLFYEYYTVDYDDNTDFCNIILIYMATASKHT